jgi:DNA topoisomerase-3
VKENYRRFVCERCGFSISKTPGSRQFETAEVEALLEKREIGPLQGFRSKMGRPFSAMLKIVPDDENKNLKLEFDFGQNRDDENSEPVDFTGQESIGACPKCGGSIYDLGLSYVCENSVNPPKTCDFRSGKIILQQEISREQMKKLLTAGRTDLLPGFKSARTGRFFKAYLVKDEGGKVSFEFEARKPAAKKVGKGAAIASAVDAPIEAKEGVQVAVSRKTVANKAAAKKAPITKAAAKKGAAKKVTAKKATSTIRSPRAPANR